MSISIVYKLMDMYMDSDNQPNFIRITFRNKLLDYGVRRVGKLIDVSPVEMWCYEHQAAHYRYKMCMVDTSKHNAMMTCIGNLDAASFKLLMLPFLFNTIEMPISSRIF